MQLPPLEAQTNTVTVSGFSGGGSFTSLLSVVEPEKFEGFGLMGSNLLANYRYEGNTE